MQAALKHQFNNSCRARELCNLPVLGIKRVSISTQRVIFCLAGLWIYLREITGVTAEGIRVPRGDDARLLDGSTLL